jgi:hypothetical protein
MALSWSRDATEPAGISSKSGAGAERRNGETARVARNARRVGPSSWAHQCGSSCGSQIRIPFARFHDAISGPEREVMPGIVLPACGTRTVLGCGGTWLLAGRRGTWCLSAEVLVSVAGGSWQAVHAMRRSSRHNSGCSPGDTVETTRSTPRGPLAVMSSQVRWQHHRGSRHLPTGLLAGASLSVVACLSAPCGSGC